MPSSREIHIVAEVPEAANQFLIATVVVGDGPIVYKSVHVWSEKTDEEASHLSTPHGIGMDKDGNILIADMDAMIHRYTRAGKFTDDISGPIRTGDSEVILTLGAALG